MLSLLDLIDEKMNVGEKLLGIIIMQDIEIDSLAPAREKRLRIVMSLDASTNLCKYQGAGIYGFEVTTRHLQNQRGSRGADGDNPGSALNAAAPFVGFGGISWNIEIC